MWQFLKKEVSSHKFLYIILGLVLAYAFYLRIYRIDQLLGFYYDQGRDALVVWDLIKNGELFLIGPTTGLAGIFRGPYYYYLIAPFYLLGNGNPVWPSVFLSFTTIAAVLIGFYLAFKAQSRITGLIFAVLAGFSYYIFQASRWLSNPTPMLFLSMLLVWSMFEIIQNSKIKSQKWWILIAFVSGLSLFNFGSSGELFYFPALLVFAISQRKKLPNLKYFAISLVAFGVTFLPLVLFDFKHEHILLNNFTKTFGEQQSFTLPTQFLFDNRNEFFSSLLPKIIFHSFGKYEQILLLVVVVTFVLNSLNFLRNFKILATFLLLLSPFVGVYFYQGNDTVLYDYYLTGYYLIFLLLISIVLGKIWKSFLGKVFVVVFIYIFLQNNIAPIDWVLANDLKGSESIALQNQLQAIDWIYTDYKDNPPVGEVGFNVDVYVPPVIPYAYDYLFKWKSNPDLTTDQVPLLYTIYEVDPPHPERLGAWLARQKGIGQVEYEQKFGGITVQRRSRY